MVGFKNHEETGKRVISCHKIEAGDLKDGDHIGGPLKPDLRGEMEAMKNYCVFVVYSAPRAFAGGRLWHEGIKADHESNGGRV